MVKKIGFMLAGTMAKIYGLWLAGAHLLAFGLTLAYVVQSDDGQAHFVWIFLYFIDLPVVIPCVFIGGLLDLAYMAYPELIESVVHNPILVELLNPLNIGVGIFGTLMWYFLPRYFMHKKYGGVWGEEPELEPSEE